jgi:serine/threonine protein kinase
MELTVQNVYGLLLRSKLMSFEDAKTMYARWQEEAKEQSTNLAKFATWMVAHKYVTEYQAGLLARGHAEGFFINEYKILDRLGKGRMAGVYKGQHTLGQIVALKVLPPSKGKDPLLNGRFQREAKLAIKLRHANIVRGFQLGRAGDLHYLVMEHLEGETLEELLLRRSSLTPPEAIRIIYQALQGLQHIHEQGLVHRDLKPSNIMLVPAPMDHSTLDCTVKILDIGLGRVLYTDTPEGEDQGLTAEGVLLGTPDYMAPEQARDPRTTDIRADIYSLGCVLYHLLTGQTPHPDTNIISQMIRHATETPKPLKEFNAAIPDGLQQIVSWMMAKEASGRYPNPERAAKALELLLVAGTPTASSPDFDPGMQTYLHWLARQDNPHSPTEPDRTMPMVALSPGANPLGAININPAKEAKDSTKPKSKHAQTVAQPDPVNDPNRSGVVKNREEPKPHGADKKAPNKKKPAAPLAPPTPPPAGKPPTEVAPAYVDLVDVELVNLPPKKDSQEESTFGPLTRRDLLMYFSGVGSGLLAYIIGRVLAWLFTRRPRQNDDNTDS